jgi:hypothetical protein
MHWVSSQASANQETKEDADITFEEYLNDEPLHKSPEVLPSSIEVTSRMDLRYFPLSLEDAQFSNNPVRNSKPHTPLSPTEEARLRTVAMPVQPYTASSVSSSPKPRSEKTRTRRSRTSSESSESDCLAPRSRRPTNKRQAHNAIEKRYRTNLVDKIAELRDSIPGLRSVDDNLLDEDSQSCSATSKLNKVCPPCIWRYCILADEPAQATILSKATEYIGELSRRTQDLTRENTALQVRINAFKVLFMAQGNSASA